MRKDLLKDVTFLILVRLDSVERLENVTDVANALVDLFDTNVKVLEADDYCNGALKAMLDSKVDYEFAEDKDPILYKTKYFNRMAQAVATPYLAIWDADIVPDKDAILETVGQLRAGGADAGLPYNGKCMDVPDILRKFYLRGKDLSVLSRNTEKMKLLYGHTLVGGAVFVRKDKYVEAGMENEIYYGWGNDDFDRYGRFHKAKLNIYRSNNFLFHLYHPRGQNSQFSSQWKIQRSVYEIKKVSMYYKDNI